MHYTLATLALAASFVSAQGVSETLKPSGSAPESCSENYDGTFEITVVKPNAKRSLIQKRACQESGTAVLQLKNSILTDAQGRIGAIVANRQFQFDGPPAQTGSIYTGGWSVCSNGTLALGPSTTFYQCLSGDFYNIYDDNLRQDCNQIIINVLPCSGTGGTGVSVPEATDGQPQSPAATQIPDGQVQASSAVPINQISDGQVQQPTGAPISQIGDGQIQATSAAAPPVSQIGDGQIQATSAAPISQIGDGQIQATSAAPPPVSQIGDGQIQATSAAPISQIGDGQIQATSAAPPPVSQIGDGQIQATSAAPISQIGDGQIQATSAAPISQIGDGQIQATTLATTGAPVSQIGDGQVQATSAADAPAPSESLFLGAAPTTAAGASFVAAVAGLAAVLML